MLLKRGNFNRTKQAGMRPRKFVYSKRTYANPFFRQGRNRSINRSSLKNKRKLAILAGLIIFLIIIWLLFFSTLFKINNIEVVGADEALAKNVSAMARELAENKLLAKNNLLLFDKTALTEALNEKYYLENLKIKKNLPHTLKINLAQKQRAAVWREAEKYYNLDGSGSVINEIDPLNIDRSAYPLIENLSAIAIVSRQANIRRQAMDYIASLFDEFKNQKHGFDIESFIVDNDINTVKLSVLGGPKIYFNTEYPMADQAAKLDRLINEKLKDNFKSKKYIDLRFGTNVYIK